MHPLVLDGAQARGNGAAQVVVGREAGGHAHRHSAAERADVHRRGDQPGGGAEIDGAVGTDFGTSGERLT